MLRPRSCPAPPHAHKLVSAHDGGYHKAVLVALLRAPRKADYAEEGRAKDSTAEYPEPNLDLARLKQREHRKQEGDDPGVEGEVNEPLILLHHNNGLAH